MVRFGVWAALAVWGVGCVDAGDEGDTATETSDETEARPGQDLLSCWVQPGESSGVKELWCKLGPEGVLRVQKAQIEARVGSTQVGTSLDASRPEAVVFASNRIDDPRLDVALTIDASDVLGLGTVRHAARLELDGATIDEPARVRAPFQTWRVALVGEEVSLRDARLEPFEVEIGGERIEIDEALPDAAVGETVVVHVPVQSAGARAGTASLGDEAERAISIDGPGTYLAKAGGLEKRWAPNGDLPVVLSCWAADEAIWCRPSEPLPMGYARVALTRADGSRSGQTVVVNHEPRVDMQVIDDADGSIQRFDVATAAFRVGAADAAAFPLTLEAEVNVGGGGGVRLGKDGAVVGLGGDDPFLDTPIELRATLGGPAEAPEDAPVVAALPFALWEITLVAEGSRGQAFQATLDPYSARQGAPWGGTDAGGERALGGALPVVAPGADLGAVPEQTFFVPVEPGHSAPLSGTLTFGATGAFTIPGPGRYVLGASGLRLAP